MVAGHRGTQKFRLQRPSAGDGVPAAGVGGPPTAAARCPCCFLLSLYIAMPKEQDRSDFISTGLISNITFAPFLLYVSNFSSCM